MNRLAYKPSFSRAAERLASLYHREASDRIFAAFDWPSEALKTFAARYAEGPCDPPDLGERLEFADAYCREQAALDDDGVPCVYLSQFDQGLYGGLFGAEVRYIADPATGWISSMVPPLLADWSQLDRLRLDLQHPVFVDYLKQLRRFHDAAADRFGISHFILIDGLNFVFELVGATDTYFSLVDRPEQVRRAIDLAFETNVAVQAAFFDVCRPDGGGTFSNMVGWIPGRIVSESVDPFHMTSVGDFERWGREPIERIFDRFDGGVLHIHANGRHLLEAVSTLRGLKAIALLDDRGFPAAAEVLGQLRRRTADVPLVVSIPLEAFARRLERGELVGGVYYRVVGVEDLETANRLMPQVREYRAP